MALLKDWARKKNRELHRKALEDRDSRLWHSRAYHRYFEGYTEYKELDANGKERIRRVYTASWYVQDVGKRNAVLLRVGYVLLFALMCGALAVASIRQGSAGTAFYAALSASATLIAAAWLGYGLLVNYLFAPKKMTVHDYHASSGTVRRASCVLAVCFAADTAATLLDAALNGTGKFDSFGWTLAAFALGGAAALLMHMTEKRVPYREIEREPAASPQGTVIGGD